MLAVGKAAGTVRAWQFGRPAGGAVLLLRLVCLVGWSGGRQAC